MSAAVATELNQLERRSKVVDLARTGQSYRSIAAELGIGSAGTVAKDIAAWAAETKPTAEQTEDLRKLQCEQIDGLAERLWPRLDSDDYLLVTDRLVKLMDRKARLMGLDLERDISVTVLPSAEQWAALMGLDGEPPIEAEALEITDGS